MKIQKLFRLFLFSLLLCSSSSLMAQSMSDQQVLEYVKEGIKQGKEQKQMAAELARKGVTKEQAIRVKELYEKQNNVNRKYYENSSSRHRLCGVVNSHTFGSTQ
nr:hypothetical protein [Bacteroides bouchesdurhonensis]